MARNHRHNASWWGPEGDGPLSIGPDSPQLNFSLNRLESLCENGHLYAVETRYGGTKYGKVVVKEGRILIYSFQLTEPEALSETRLISLQELLSRFHESPDLPETSFLKLSSWCDKEDSFEVIIQPDGVCQRFQNFSLLCSGLKGPSYKARILRGGFDCFGIPQGPPPVVDGIRRSDLETPLKQGRVYGMDENNSWFWIQLKDHPTLSFPKFGLVVAGLQNFEGRRANCIVTECGLVIL